MHVGTKESSCTKKRFTCNATAELAHLGGVLVIDEAAGVPRVGAPGPPQQAVDHWVAAVACGALVVQPLRKGLQESPVSRQVLVLLKSVRFSIAQHG